MERDNSSDAAAGEPERARAGKRRPLLRAVGLVLLLALLYLAWEGVTWPDVAALAAENPETTAFIERYRAERRRAGENDAVSWTWVPYARISPHLKRAVLVAEDINFFSHDGFDRGEMRVALKEAVEAKKLPRGASTLTQQLAKNLWLSPSRNPLRKVKEALLTRQLEAHLTKRRILELYLNVVELGPGVYGAEAAARRYYGVSAAGLSEWQGARLAAALPSPRRWHPGGGSSTADRRAGRIQSRMAKARFLWKEI